MSAAPFNKPAGRPRWHLVAAALIGIALLSWTIASRGPRQLLVQQRSLNTAFWVVLALAGFRFWLQAAGWRIAMPASQRPSWREVFAAVVAGEAAGYFAWGPVTREPIKAWLVAHRLPKRA